MSDIIHLLPDSVANQIAAGEVIQRPASVIKELTENAIDAGATLVQIKVTEAGRACIQVVDNGKGMSETDARLAFERHATSKISVADDLFSLRTMGFRGEALASIAAVAQVELKTRRPEDELGTMVTVEGSRVTGMEPTACPVGANFMVRNLFFNIPARRKFLKSNQTELASIVAELERIALAHPDIAFTLHQGDSLLLDLPAGNFHQRILNLFGKKLDTRLVPVHVQTSLADISGFVGTPDSSRKKGARQFFFANRRFMRHPYFAKAVQSAYERLIPEGEQVPFFLAFDVDPARIDVNIHPTKTEIKFQDESALWQILQAAVREALGRHNLTPTIDFDTENKPEIPVFSADETSLQSVTPPQITVDPAFNPFTQPVQPQPAHSQRRDAEAYTHLHATLHDALPEAETSQRHHSAPASWSQPQQENSEPAPLLQAEGIAACLQYRGRFIITPAEDGLLLVDQHRAHTRILYDRYLKQLGERRGITQGILFPQVVSLSPSESVQLESLREDLESIGFDISHLGGGEYAVTGIPAGTEGLDPSQLLRSLLEPSGEAATGTPGIDPQLREKVWHRLALALARKAALPVGQALETQEMTHLLERLSATSNPRFTPDGKPILTLLPHLQLERGFQ